MLLLFMMTARMKAVWSEMGSGSSLYIIVYIIQVFILPQRSPRCGRLAWARRTLTRQCAAYVLDKQFAPYPVTPFARIQKLAPGEQLVIRAGEIIDRHRHKPLAQPCLSSDPAELDSHIHDSVEAHQMSDVPFGLFLSGGVDSSVLLAMMSRLRQAGSNC